MIYAAAALLSLLAAIALNWAAIMPPLQDFNEWLYQGYLVKTILAGQPGGFMLKPWPVPNAAAQLLLGGLNFLFDPLRAGQMFITLYVIAFAAVAWRLCRRPDGTHDTPRLALLVPLAMLNSPWWSGYVNFQLGMLLLCVHLLLVRDNRHCPAWLEALFGVLMFFTHAATLAVFGVHVGWRSLGRRGLLGGTLRAVLVMLPSLLLLDWYIHADHDYGETIPQQGRGIAGFLAYKAYTIAKSGPYQNLLFGDGGDFARHPLVYRFGVGLDCLFAVVVAVPLFAGSLRSLLKGRAVPGNLTALTCFAAFALLPSALFGVVNIGERFLVPALVFALVCGDDWWRLRRFGAALACTLPVLFLYAGFLLPAQPTGEDIDHLAVTDPARQSQLLFWHRPFQFAAHLAAADQAAATGTVPTEKLGFTTSIVAAK